MDLNVLRTGVFWLVFDWLKQCGYFFLPSYRNCDFDTITDNNSSPAGYSDFCAVSDLNQATLASNGTNSTVSCDDLQQTSAVHPALYFFVVANLLIGFGGCGIFILTFPYIDENSPQNKSALYLGMSVFCFVFRCYQPTPTMSDRVEAVCLSVCMLVRSITQKRMTPKCSNLI